MRDLVMAGTYVVNSDKLEIGGVPILFFLLGVAVFVVLIAVVIICICSSSKKKSNRQGAPLQPAVGQPPRPVPPMPPQPGQGVPIQPMQGAPVQYQPMQGAQVRSAQPTPVQVQPAPVQVQPTPVQVQPAPVQVQARPVQVQPAPVQVQPTPVQMQPTPVQVQARPVPPAPSASGTFGYGVSAADDNDKTQIIMDEDDSTQIMTEDDDSTQIMTREYVLCLSDKTNPEKTFRVPLRGTVIIGRRAGEVNLVIDYDKSVSGRHCQVREADGRVFVEDLQSANGTMVDGLRILSETEIVSGSVLTLGRVELKVDICCE